MRRSRPGAAAPQSSRPPGAASASTAPAGSSSVGRRTGTRRRPSGWQPPGTGRRGRSVRAAVSRPGRREPVARAGPSASPGPASGGRSTSGARSGRRRSACPAGPPEQELAGARSRTARWPQGQCGDDLQAPRNSARRRADRNLSAGEVGGELTMSVAAGWPLGRRTDRRSRFRRGAAAASSASAPRRPFQRCGCAERLMARTRRQTRTMRELRSGPVWASAWAVEAAAARIRPPASLAPPPTRPPVFGTLDSGPNSCAAARRWRQTLRRARRSARRRRRSVCSPVRRATERGGDGRDRVWSAVPWASLTLRCGVACFAGGCSRSSARCCGMTPSGPAHITATAAPVQPTASFAPSPRSAPCPPPRPRRRARDRLGAVAQRRQRLAAAPEQPAEARAEPLEHPGGRQRQQLERPARPQ